MGSKGGFVLLRFLLILAVLCHSGYCLTCYSCVAVGVPCNYTTNCTYPADSCLFFRAASRLYYMCWKFSDCTFQNLSTAWMENELQYRCCQEDLCNGHPGMTSSGQTVLLVAPLLVAAWNLGL